jgi:mRNA-degrading endonuclease RelE of RelBE toxin-antitoxin system
MKKVHYAPAVEMSMSSLDPDGVRRVQAWFDYLKRWDEDEVVRKNSLPLPDHQGVYVLKTTTDIRIFFRIDGDTITVLDIAKQSAIIASGGIRSGGSADVTLTPGEKQRK